MPTNLLGGANLEGTTLTAIETNLGLLAALGTTSTTYGTLVPNDLPLLEPLRLPVRLINVLSNALGTRSTSAPHSPTLCSPPCRYW